MQRFREIAPGVLVATSQLLTCTSTAVLADDGGCLVIDPAVSVAVRDNSSEAGYSCSGAMNDPLDTPLIV